MSTSKRHALLATTGIASATVLFAYATAVSASTLTYNAPVTSTSVNTDIAGQSGPDLSIVVKSAGKVDTGPGSINIEAPTFVGALGFDNQGLVGLAPSTNTGLYIGGDISKAGQTVVITNEGTFNNTIYVDSVGGTASLVNTGTINTGSTSAYAVYDSSAGNDSLSSTTGSTIEGAVLLYSQGISDAKTNQPTGGVASAVVNGNLGLVGGAPVTSDNPKGFVGSRMYVSGVGGATVSVGDGTMGSGEVGPILALSGTSFDYVTPTVVTMTTDGAGNVTTTSANAEIAGGGGATVTLASGSDEFGYNNFGSGLAGGVVAAGGRTGETVTINGTVHDTSSNAVFLYSQGSKDTTDVKTGVVDKSANPISYDETTTTTDVGGGGVLAVGKGGLIEGSANVQAEGNSTASVAGTIDGNLTVNTYANKDTSELTFTYDPLTGHTLEENYVITQTNLAPTAGVSVAGLVKGAVVANGGGNVTGDVAGEVGSLSLTSSGQTGSLGEDVKYTYDAKTLNKTSETFTETYAVADSGGAATLTVEGKVDKGVSVSALTGITATITGTTGNVALSDQGTNETSKLTEVQNYDPVTGNPTTGSSDTASATTNIGGPVSLTVGPAATTGDISVAADSAVTAEIGGTTGGLAIISVATNSTSTDHSTSTNDGSGDFSNTVSSTQAAAGGPVTVTVDKGAVINGTVNVAADGAILVTNLGSIEGDLIANSARNLETAQSTTQDQSTTIPTPGTVVVVTDNNSSSTTQTVGSTVDIHNNSSNTIVGNTIVHALGNVTFENAGGENVGNVELYSQGVTNTAADTSQTTTTTVANDIKDPTKGSVVTVVDSNSSNASSTATGGSVTGTYAGTVGLDNNYVGGLPVGKTPGTLISQTADQASTVNVTGSVFGANIQSTAGSYNSASSKSSTSTDVQSLDGSKNIVTETYNKSGSSSSSSTVNSGGLSTVMITGKVIQPNTTAGYPEGSSSVSSTGTSGSSVTLNNGQVDGDITATSAAQNQTGNGSYTESYAYGAGGYPAYTAYAYNATSTTTTTQAGGAALVDLSTGTNVVGGDAAAYGSTTATVNLGAASSAGGVYAQVGDYENLDALDVTTTKVEADSFDATSGNFTYSTTNTSTSATAAINGNALAQVDGTVSGSVEAIATSGTATANVNNTVGDYVYVWAHGASNSSTNTTVYAGPLGHTVEQTYSSVTSDKDFGGTAIVNLTAPGALVAKNGILVGDYVEASGDGSATITLNKGVIVGGDVEGYSGGYLYTTSDMINYVNSTEVYTKTNTDSGGSALITSAGKINGSVYAYDYGDGTAEFDNNGVVLGDVSVYAGDVRYDGVFGENYTSTTTTSNLGTLKASDTEVTTYTPVGGTTTLVNNGEIAGAVYVGGATNTVTNNGGIGGGIISNSASYNYTLTTMTTPTSTTSSVVVNPTLFNTTTLVNQNGLVLAGPSRGECYNYSSCVGTGGGIGIQIGGATVADPTDPTGVNRLLTTNVTGTINLNNGSVTLGSIGDALKTDINPTTGLMYTNVDVNLNGTNFIGNAPVGVFTQAPNFTPTQLSTIADSGFITTNGYAVGTGSIIGVQTLAVNGPGTSYFYGAGFNNQGTADPSDDFYDISAVNFNIGTAGEVQFALASSSSSISSYALTAPTIVGGPPSYGIAANIDNAGTFVLGHYVTVPNTPNLSNLLNPTNTVVSGLNFTVLGNFTQEASGTLVAGVTPDLIRAAPVALTPGVSTDILGNASYFIAEAPFTIPSKSVIPMSTPSFVALNGNLSLAGTLELGVNRGALYANGTSTPLFDVTGTVDVSKLTVVPAAPSQFVGFDVTTAPGTGTDTIVSINTVRTSYTTAALNQNSRAAAAALDSAVTPTINAITADANGTAVFPSVQRFSQVQDMASVIAGLDWYLSPAQVSAALNELASGEFYGSLLAVDNTVLLTKALNEYSAADERTAPAGINVWLTPAYKTTSYDGSTTVGSAGLSDNNTGINGGIQLRPTDKIGVGIGGGWAQANINAQNQPISAHVDTYGVGLYGSYQFGQFYATGDFVFGHSTYNTNRELPTFGRLATANFTGNEYRGGAEIGYDFKSDNMPGVVSPFVAVDIRSTNTHGFTEDAAIATQVTSSNAYTSAGGIALNVAPSSDTITAPVLGVRWGSYTWHTGNFAVIPSAVASYTFLTGVNTQTTQQFVGGGEPFVTHGISPNGYFTIGGQLKVDAGSRGSLWISANGDFGGSETAGTFTAGASIKF